MFLQIFKQQIQIIWILLTDNTVIKIPNCNFIWIYLIHRFCCDTQPLVGDGLTVWFKESLESRSRFWLNTEATRMSLFESLINPFHATGLFLHPLENIRKPVVFCIEDTKWVIQHISGHCFRFIPNERTFGLLVFLECKKNGT